MEITDKRQETQQWRWLKAIDHIAAKARKQGDERTSIQIVCDELNISPSTLRTYRRGDVLVPVDRATEIQERFGFPKKMLRPDVWS